MLSNLGNWFKNIERYSMQGQIKVMLNCSGICNSNNCIYEIITKVKNVSRMFLQILCLFIIRKCIPYLFTFVSVRKPFHAHILTLRK